MSKAIGIFDSGIGGITVLKELKRQLPNEQFIYLGDSARLPYGTKGVGTIMRYARECSDFLYKQNIKLLVIACNTASSIACQSLAEEADFPVIGTIEPVVASLAANKAKNIAVIGTRATILSNAFEKAIKARIPNSHVRSIACPLFVPLVEEGIFTGPVVDASLDLYLKDLRETSIEFDSLVLGCTHYPLLDQALREYLGPKLKIIHCGESIAQAVSNCLGQLNQLQTSPSKRPDLYYVTDAPERFNILANLFMGLNQVESVKVEIG